tara:strand:+ start:425 stop:706 length:282 start_codon:yes stop_codon:yes gene_type:complete
MTPEYRLMLQSRAKQQQQDKLDKQQHFDSQRQHLNNVHKDNYGQLQNLVKSDFYKTVQTTLKKNNKKEYIQNKLQKTMDDMTLKHLEKFEKSV